MTKENHSYNKQELRYIYRQKRQSLSKEYTENASEKLCSILTELTRSFSTIVSFWSHPDEININPFNQYLIQEKTAVFPKVADQHLHLYTVRDEGHLQEGRFGLKEPSKDICPLFQEQQKIDLILVPGVVFDHNRNRIGYGGGYYDRLLARFPNTLSWGVCFKEQIVLTGLPLEKHDQVVSRIVHN